MNDTTQQTYRVLARKYRPETFSKLIGQDALVRTLSNAIRLGRLAHAFILTGVRGTGKTSTARLLAKGLNCVGTDGTSGPTLEPCGECEPCQAITAGRHIDVLEIDAASHTGVDDVREIIESVGYRPVSSRFKVYIIDEVHMMSKNAFNALLKTLEEPPSEVKFIFATTEIRKVPVTILSRCQRYDLRRVPTVLLIEHLTSICDTEKITASAEALAIIARNAEGSVRDALSLLDQAAAMTADTLTAELLTDMLGRPGQQESQAVLAAALEGNTTLALAAFTEAYSHGTEPEMLVADLLDLIHIACMHAAGSGADYATNSDAELVRSLAKFGIARLGRAWQLLLKGHGELAHAPNPAAGCEMLIIRLAHAALMPTPGDILQKLPLTPQEPVVSQPAPSSANTNPLKATMTPTKTECIAEKQTTNFKPDQVTLIEAPKNHLIRTENQQNIALHIQESTYKNDQKHPEPLNSLSKIVALAEAKNELLLAARIRNHVRLVSLQPEFLELSLTGNIPHSFADDLSKKLSLWTKQRWLVIVSDKKGANTLAEDARGAAAKTKDAIALDPLIVKIMGVFPGASIDHIKSAFTEPCAITVDMENNANFDNEEMSG